MQVSIRSVNGATIEEAPTEFCSSISDVVLFAVIVDVCEFIRTLIFVFEVTIIQLL